MAFNSGGLLVRLYSWQTDASNDIKINSQRMDNEFDNIFNGLNSIIQGTQPFIGPLKGGLGSPANPSHSFKDESGTGMYRHSAGELGFSLLGVTKALIKDKFLKFLGGAYIDNNATITNAMDYGYTVKSFYPALNLINRNTPGALSSVQMVVTGNLLKIIADADNDDNIGVSGNLSHFDLVTVSVTNITYRGNIVWNAGNDGAGSGLDADTVDGLQASQFVRSDTGTIANARLSTDVMYMRGEIGASSNLNTYTTTGIYKESTNAGAAGGTNYPSARAGILMVVNAGSIIYQTYQEYDGTDYYFRSYYDGTWYGWKKIFHNGNDGAGSGLDADTVDGLQASQFLRSDISQRLEGRLEVGYIGAEQLRLGYNTGGALEPFISIYNGQTTRRGYIQGDVSRLQLVHDTGGSLEIYTSGLGKINGNKIWTEGNHGAGSGLDADTVDGLQASQFVRSDSGTIPTARMPQGTGWTPTGVDSYVSSDTRYVDLGDMACISFDVALSSGDGIITGVPAQSEDKVAFTVHRATGDSTGAISGQIHSAVLEGTTIYLSTTAGGNFRGNICYVKSSA